MTSKRIDENGFSLIEVMAAVVVLAIAVAGLLQLSSGGLRLARHVEDRTALVAAADGMLRTFWTGGVKAKEILQETGDIECRAEVFPFRQKEERTSKLVEIAVTARNKTTGAEYRLTSLKEE